MFNEGENDSLFLHFQFLYFFYFILHIFIWINMFMFNVSKYSQKYKASKIICIITIQVNISKNSQNLHKTRPLKTVCIFSHGSKQEMCNILMPKCISNTVFFIKQYL